MNGQNHAKLSDDALNRFTATGQSFQPHSTTDSYAIAMTTSETFGHGPANLLPLRYTDESIISVPVLPAITNTETETDTDTKLEPPTSQKPVFISTFLRRLSSSSNSISRSKSKSKSKFPDFVMRDMTRGEYLRSYAKDTQGRYCGSGPPARDCILNHKEDRLKHRRDGAGAGAGVGVGLEAGIESESESENES